MPVIYFLRTLRRLLVALLCLVGWAATASTSSDFLGSLTEQERAWLLVHPVIRVVQDPDWPPIEFTDARGNPSGMTKDYLTLIEQRLGQKFEPVLGLSWQEAYARLQRGEIDMTTTVAETPERLEFWAFTKPYMNIPIAIAAQQDVGYIAGLHELAGKKVAAVEGYAVNEWMHKDFPEVPLVNVKTSLEGLQRLQRGEVDAFIDSLATIGHYQATREVLNLKIAGATPYFNAQRMAVRKDWAPLAGILQKALDSISAAERDEIFHRWLPIRYEHGFDYTLLWQVLLGCAVVVLGMGFWNRKLSREISERKLAQRALARSEQNLAITLHSVGDAVIATDAQGLVTRMNPVAERLTGWLLTEALGQPLAAVFNIVNAQTRMPSANSVQRAMETGTVVGLANHTLLLARDGQEYQISDNAAPIRDAAQAIVGVVLVFSDVSGKYQADEHLRIAKNQLEIFFTHAPVAVAMFDRDMRYLYASCRWQQDYAITDRAVRGLSHYAVLPEITDAWKAVHLRGLAGETVKAEADRFERSDGTLQWLHWEVRPWHEADGAVGGILIFSEDISQRRAAEDALRGAKNHLQTTLNAIPDLLFEVDAGGCILSYHTHRSDLLAAPPEVFMGKSLADVLPPAATAVCMQALNEAAVKGWSAGATYSLPLAQGQSWFELSAAAMPVEAGAARRFILLTRDISARKEAKLALEQTLREKTALLLEVHHRVKNNLQVITSLLRLEASRRTEGPTKAVLQDMQGRVRSMALLHETVYRKGTFAAIDLGSYIGQVAVESMKTLQTHPGAVQLQLDVEEAQVSLDQATPAGMLISELVSNCLKHAFPAGRGGTITIALHPLAATGPWRLQVRDTGVGLPANFAARRKNSLGLQLAGDMAIQMGGELQLGDGPQAVFTVDFTLDCGSAAALP